MREKRNTDKEIQRKKEWSAELKREREGEGSARDKQRKLDIDG